MINKTTPTVASFSHGEVDADLKSSFTIDRSLPDTLTLPHSYYNVSIKPNEIVTADSINASLQKLYYNFLYLNAQSKLPANGCPATFGGVVMAPISPKVVETGTFTVNEKIIGSAPQYWVINNVQNPTLSIHRG